MKQTLKFTAAAVGLAACMVTPCAAQSSLLVYGIADVYTGRYQLSGRDDTGVVGSGGLSTSRIGFRGSEDLGGGYRINLDLTAFIRMDTGEQGRFPGDPLWSQRASLGVSGWFGSVDAGRVATPLFVTMISTNPFGDSSSFSPIFLHLYTGGQPLAAPLTTQDFAANNSITYISPVFAGLKLRAQYGFREVPGQSDEARIGASLNYDWRALNAQVAYARDSYPLLAGETEQTTWLGTLTYDFKFAKLYGQYAISDYDTLDRDYDTFEIGVILPVFRSSQILVSWANTQRDDAAANAIDPERNTVALSYVYNWSKRTEVYCIAMRDKVTDLNSGTSAVIGMRHKY